MCFRLSGIDPAKPGRTEPLPQGLDSKDQDPQEDLEEQEPSPASQEPLQECLNITLVQFLLCPLNTTFRGIEKLHINIFQMKYTLNRTQSDSASVLVSITSLRHSQNGK